MRHLYLALATTLATTLTLGTAAVPASASEIPSPAERVAAPRAAIENALEKGEVQAAYAQWRGRYYGHRGWYGRHGWYGPRYGYYYGRPYYRRDYGAAAAAGAIGLATGAIIGGALAQQQQAAPVYAAPGNGAVAYCAQRFKSYDPASGTYLGYDGRRHPCP
ncbi:BA14K family protein [Microvirga thermotolerans]|uniref:Lectin-like protein BA14k n=1 Tax=Microvirga thermotolerans TaxID=2651334 RepID=A0A5P9JUU3_9HYPH|nr:BA14K family protein [Microvirga thermotolerans]QFU14945.1 BA14K family protein [Microvirga thermotolerans]